MTPETKFRELERRAMVHLMRPLDARKVADINRTSLIVLIWRHPAFEPYQSWSLINGKVIREEFWFVRRTTWDHCTDRQRAFNPLKQAAFMIDPDATPTIEVQDVRTDAGFAEQIIGRLSGLSVPSLLTPDSIGVDGVMNGIESQRGQVHLEWWCDGPPAWRLLTEDVERLRLDLDAAVEPNLT